MKVEKVYLFGSYARNSQSETSDLDIAVILEHSQDNYFDVHPKLWKLRRQIDYRIEPILLERSHDESGFIEELERTGIEI